MPVWKTNPISEEPVIELGSWYVFSVQSPHESLVRHYFNGYSENGQEGRVSSEIVSFDKEKMLGVTRSGRRYQLVGPPGFNQDAYYVFSRWLKINKVDIDHVQDVTLEYWKEEDAT